MITAAFPEGQGEGGFVNARGSPNVWSTPVFVRELLGPQQEFSHRKDVLTGRLPGPPTNPFNHNRADGHCRGWSWLPSGKSA